MRSASGSAWTRWILGQLKFVYEKELAAFPSLAVVLGRHGPLRDPAFGLDHRMMVAAALKVVLHEPLPTEAKLVARPRVRAVIDKGRGQRRHHRDDARSPGPRRPRGRDRRQQHAGAQARRLRRQGHADRRAARGAGHMPRNTWSIYRRRPISRWSTGSPATRTRCMRIPSARVRSASSGRSCTAPRPTGSRPMRWCVTSTTGPSSSPASRRASCGRCFRATRCARRSRQDGNRISFQCRALGRDGLVLTNGLATLRGSKSSWPSQRHCERSEAISTACARPRLLRRLRLLAMTRIYDTLRSSSSIETPCGRAQERDARARPHRGRLARELDALRLEVGDDRVDAADRQPEMIEALIGRDRRRIDAVARPRPAR